MDGPRVRVEQQLLVAEAHRVDAVPPERTEAVQLACTGSLDVRVEYAAIAAGQTMARLLAGNSVEQAQVHAVGTTGENGEVDTRWVQAGTQRVRIA